MTLDDVRARLAEIRLNAGDDERQHSIEDQLYLDVLTAVAEGAENGAELAREALKANEMEFARWCA